jgi:Flp pilus assembly pilin Flp
MAGLVESLGRDESGVAAIDYGLLLGLIALAAVGAFALLASSVTDIYEVNATAVRDVADRATAP